MGISNSKFEFQVKNLLDLNGKKSAESQISISNFDLNSKNRNNKTQLALSEREGSKILLQENIKNKEKIIEYLMKHFWESLEIHNRSLVSFNCKTFVSNFSLRRIDKLEKMDDFAIELFNTPLSNKYNKLSDRFPVQCELPLKTSDKCSNESNNYLYSNCNNDVVFTGSTSFKWIKDDVAPNQLSNIVIDNINYVSTAHRENRLKVHFICFKIQISARYTL